MFLKEKKDDREKDQMLFSHANAKETRFLKLVNGQKTNLTVCLVAKLSLCWLKSHQRFSSTAIVVFIPSDSVCYLSLTGQDKRSQITLRIPNICDK